MKVRKKELHGRVRDGYQILLRADAELLFPTAGEQMRAFYGKLGETCMSWALEVHGDRLRRAFGELETVREKSRFHTGRYRFRMRIPWEEPPYVAIVCESELTGELIPEAGGYFRISHVWNCEEELMLPTEQILRLLDGGLSRRMFPFRPDGVYPEGEHVVLFRNATAKTAWEETRLPWQRKQEDTDEKREGK